MVCQLLDADLVIKKRQDLVLLQPMRYYLHLTAYLELT